MAIPAGQLLLVGGHDVSKDATNFGLTLDSPAQVVTGLFHEKVQRDQVAAEDSTFELSGFFPARRNVGAILASWRPRPS